eukprot:344579-Chlamydomonas_euryale.AAC.2
MAAQLRTSAWGPEFRSTSGVPMILVMVGVGPQLVAVVALTVFDMSTVGTDMPVERDAQNDGEAPTPRTKVEVVGSHAVRSGIMTVQQEYWPTDEVSVWAVEYCARLKMLPLRKLGEMK